MGRFVRLCADLALSMLKYGYFAPITAAFLSFSRPRMAFHQHLAALYRLAIRPLREFSGS